MALSLNFNGNGNDAGLEDMCFLWVGTVGIAEPLPIRGIVKEFGTGDGDLRTADASRHLGIIVSPPRLGIIARI